MYVYAYVQAASVRCTHDMCVISPLVQCQPPISRHKRATLVVLTHRRSCESEGLAFDMTQLAKIHKATRFATMVIEQHLWRAQLQQQVSESHRHWMPPPQAKVPEDPEAYNKLLRQATADDQLSARSVRTLTSSGDNISYWSARWTSLQGGDYSVCDIPYLWVQGALASCMCVFVHV